MKNKFLTDTRVTGLLYLGLAITGIFVFMFARAQIFVSKDALATTSNLVQKESLARMGIAVELILVVFQALAAVWFYKLFRKLDNFAAGLIVVFGMVNAIAILVSSAMWLSALRAALAGESAALVTNIFGVHETIWLVAGIFFGLWLLPMGYLAAKAKMPKALAWFLYAGGVGYIVSTLLLVVSPGQGSVAMMMTMPATVGEFWMIGYLLVKPRLNVEE
jgi:Domain of unknown function (DUF4386)